MRDLIEAQELVAIADGVRICDLRWDLTDPDKGRATYERGHIKGAVFVDLDRDLASPPGQNGRHPLPPVADFAATLGRLGINPGTSVVAYDDVGGRIAARLWWMLRSIGHQDVAVLNGGFAAWTSAGGDIGVGTVTPEPTTYPVPDRFSGVVDHTQLGDRPLVDARAADRYRGEVEPVDPKAGHIPGAINIPTASNLDHEGRFVRPDQASDIYAGIGANPVVSCGSGVTACHNALAMVVAGRSMPDVYVGSFSEWSRLDKPVNTGSTP